MDLLICVLMVILALLLIGLWYLYSSGLFFKITVETVVSPYPNFQVAYKFFKGPYKNVGKGFEDVYKLAPEYQCFAVYYDDPNQVSASDLRAIAGCMLAEGDSKLDDVKVKVLTENGYKLSSFPKADNVVRTWFPLNTRLSILVAVFRVWSKLASYTKKNSLKAYPWMEICAGQELHYVGFLDHQEDYIVPEVKGE